MNLNPFELRENDYYAKDAYEKDKWGDYSANKLGVKYGSYEYLLACINTDIDWDCICYTGSYQGELYCLGNLNDKYYYVSTGYGSCSGCDWYQANEGTIEGLQEIQDALKSDIREFDTINEVIEYLTRDENYKWNKEEIDEFLNDINLKYNILKS